MTYLQAVILGILQGITEFFPVSSSGHLVLAQKFFGIEENVLTFDIYVHFGTLLAVLAVFRKLIINLIYSCVDSFKVVVSGNVSISEVYKNSHEIRIISGIITGTFPALIVGFTMKDFIEGLFHTAGIVLAALFFTGFILLITFFIKERKHQIGSVHGFFIGIAQALAIVPGISRSGMTISTALFLGIKREEACEFSFLLSIPVILGATALELKDYFGAGFSTMPWDVAFIGTFASFISGWISLVFLMRIVRRGKIGYFGFYCLAVVLAYVII